MYSQVSAVVSLGRILSLCLFFLSKFSTVDIYYFRTHFGFVFFLKKDLKNILTLKDLTLFQSWPLLAKGL